MEPKLIFQPTFMALILITYPGQWTHNYLRNHSDEKQGTSEKQAIRVDGDYVLCTRPCILLRLTSLCSTSKIKKTTLESSQTQLCWVIPVLQF